MDQKRVFILTTGTRLVLEGELLICYDQSGHEINLTQGQQRLLKKLANNVNCQVSMSELYKAYSGEDTAVDDRGIRENIAKMKNTLPICIKDSIKSVRGYGYKLIDVQDSQVKAIELSADPTDCIQNLDGHSNFRGITGDYYGFFLDPVGNGSVLGAYFHLEDRGDIHNPDITVSAILGIRDNDILLNERISEVFSETGGDYHQNFKHFMSTRSANNKRCFWAEGKLISRGSVAEIALKTPIGAQWTIWVDLGGYLERTRNEGDYKYKGGVGLVVALTPSYGTFCCKLGLVRSSYMKSSILLNDPSLKQILKISDTNEWNPLLLDVRADRYWYNWCMTE